MPPNSDHVQVVAEQTSQVERTWVPRSAVFPQK